MGKGQICLILGIVTVVILVMLRTSLNLTRIIEEKRHVELGLESQQFSNVRSETLKAVSIGYNESSNMTRNAEDFLKFARNSLKASAVDLNGLILSSYFPTATAGTDIKLNVTTLNLLGAELLNLTLTFNSSSRIFTSIADGYSVSTDFTFNTGSNLNSTLSVYYLTAYENKTENITIPIEIGKSKFIGFFDLRLISSRQEQRDKFTKTYTLS